MIVSGWLELVASGSDTVSVDWTPEIGGLSILAVISLSAYTQGTSGDAAGAAAGYVRGYTPVGGDYTPIPGDPRNNAYYLNECQSVQFRLAGSLVHAYAHAAAYQLGGVGGFARLEHRDRWFELVSGGRVIARQRISELHSSSHLQVDAILSRWRDQLVAHHGLSPASVTLSEITPEVRSTTLP